MLSDALKHLEVGIPYVTTARLIINSIIYSILYKDNYRRSTKEIKCQTIEPFLSPIDKKYQYTLVLDMDETLIHYVSVIISNCRHLTLSSYSFDHIYMNF
jgi:hypothetical protein